MKYNNNKKKDGCFRRGGKKGSNDRDPFFEEETTKRRKVSYENGFTGVDVEMEDVYADEKKRKRLTEDTRNWAELPPELTSEILSRLDMTYILKNAQKVCRSWRNVCKDPWMWRKIDLGSMRGIDNLEIMCRHAVDRSLGGLVEIVIWYYGTDELLNYIADRCSNLKSLTLACCSRITDHGFVEAVEKIPLLEYLDISNCSLSSDSLKVLGKSSPNLKTLKVNKLYDVLEYARENNNIALAIAETMPGLHHLELFNNTLSDTGLKSILDNCPDLEYLDIRLCFKINRYGDIIKRCYERVKVVT